MGASEVVYQDDEGFLWFGTVNGLVRFDGYEARSFTHDPADSTSIAGHNVNAIGQDAFGRIWVGLRAYGLDILDTEYKGFTHVCLPDSALHCMTDINVNGVALSGDHMWVGSEKGLLQFTTAEKPEFIKRFGSNPDDEYSLTNDYVTNVVIDSRGRLWIGTLKGINLYDFDRQRFINHRTNATYPAVQILDIEEDRNGQIWLSPRFVEECLLKFDETTQNFVPIPEYRDRRLGEFRIAFDHQDDMWISARSVGAYHVDMQTGERTFFNPQHAAVHRFRNIYSLHTICDRYGNIWMAGNHVMKWPATGKAITSFTAQDAPVTSVYASALSIWFSDLEPRRFDRSAGVTQSFWPSHLPTPIRPPDPDAPRSRIVYRIQDYYPGEVVITATRNVYVWNTLSDTYKEFPLDLGGPFRDFVITDDSAHIWICGNQGSPILLNLKTGAHSRPDIAASILNPICVAKSDNGDLWFGSGTNGVYRLDAQTGVVENFAPHDSEPSHRLSDYFINDIVTSGQYVWIGTNLGLNMIDTKTLTSNQLRRQLNFENENVMSVLVDDIGDVWLGTQQDMTKYDPESGTLTRYDRSDGLINTVYAQGACFRDSRGFLYFGGDRGVDIIDPSKMGMNKIAPDLYIRNILVNSSPADTTVAPHHLNALSLKHTENFIEIELLALHLTAPEANQYAYRIPELDITWRELGTQRIITLANMRPGNYTLQARAANADGVWCDDKTLVHVYIRPPFWATSWFIMALVFALGTLLYLGYRYRIRQIRTQERLKAEFNKRIAELESKALRAQMNPHFLFNSINSVKSLISQGENEKATQYLTRFGRLIRQVLSNSERSFVRLQEELEALRLYLEIEQLRFQNFSYDIQVTEGVNADFIEVPPLILQPYVENAIWHGLMHKTSGDRRVTVCLMRTGDFLHMTVQDNGIGREKAQQLKMLGNARKSGMGMRLTGDRLLLLHKIYGQDVSVIVEDLHENGTASGTRVEIRIPCME
jgi:streptogramin lyase